MRDPDHRFKAEYERALEYAKDWSPGPHPAWEELTEEQKENVRKATRDNDTYMQKLGDAIRNGTELPKPI